MNETLHRVLRARPLSSSSCNTKNKIRLKLKLTVQKEVMNGAVLQEAVVIEYVVRNQQCPDCQASYTTGAWKAIVQVRGNHCVG